VKVCFADHAALERYPKELTIDQLGGQYLPVSACDWALLADAYARRSLVYGDEWRNGVTLHPIPIYGQYAYAKAVSQNPAYSLGSGPLFIAFMGEAPLMDGPELPGNIVAIEYHYILSALGPSADETILIVQGDTQPIAYTTGSSDDFDNGHKEWSYTGHPSAVSIQGLKSKFSHLIPVSNKPEAHMGGPACGEWGMNWRVTITFSDSSVITAQSATSIAIEGGGPTLFQFNSHDYAEETPYFFVQNSSEFLQGLTALLVEANPHAEAAKWSAGAPFCGWEFLDFLNPTPDN
jgi:hypothetical protein